MKHCIGIHLLSREDIIAVIVRALRFTPHYYRNDKPPNLPVLVKEDAWLPPQVGYLFQEASSRTIGSLREAAERLGFRSSFPILEQTSSLKKGEPPTRATITAIEQHNDMLCFRTTTEGFALQAAYYLERERDRFPSWFQQVPIINGGDGRQNHPTQILLDATAFNAYHLGFTPHTDAGLACFEENLRTMSDEDLSDFVQDKLDHLKIAFLGDQSNSRVVGSWLDMGRKFDLEFVLIAPPVFRLEPWRLDGLKVSVSDRLTDALDANITYVLRAQIERLEKLMTSVEAEAVLEELTINHSFLDRYQGVVMHAQPIDRERPMIDPAIWGDPKVIMDLQATVGPPTRVSIFLTCWENRQETTPLLAVPPVEPLAVEAEETIAAHQLKLAEKVAKGQGQRSVNPLDNGMVFDHLLLGTGTMVDFFLERSGVYGREGSEAIIAKRRKSPRKGRKDIVFLEDLFVPYEVLAGLTLFEPDLRVIELKSGIYRKLVFGLPGAIASALFCPNKDCVTRLDDEARSFLWVLQRGDKVFLDCAFCRHRFTSKQVLKQFQS